MKTLILIIASAILGLFTVKAQTNETVTKDTSKKISWSVDYDSDDESFSRSFTVLDLEKYYKIKVRFMKRMESDVQSYLINRFGKENMAIQDSALLWDKKYRGEQVYEVRLKGNKLKIQLNKELATEGLIKKFIETGEELKSVTSNAKKS